jgi:hypothetical protein
VCYIVGSVMVVAADSTGSSAVVVAASVRWVSASEATTVASRFEGVAFAFALASVFSSSVVA